MVRAKPAPHLANAEVQMVSKWFVQALPPIFCFFDSAQHAITSDRYRINVVIYRHRCESC
ncbi:MAG: hypothetical protein ACK6DE_09210 [Pseudanabaena sp.]